MNSYTKSYQDCDELCITKSELENQIIMNFCMVNDINAVLNDLGNSRWKVLVSKPENIDDDYRQHLQQCRDAISGIVYAIRCSHLFNKKSK